MERVSVGASARLTVNPSRRWPRNDEQVYPGAAVHGPVEALFRTGSEGS